MSTKRGADQYFSAPKNFNDPIDSVVPLSFQLNPKEKKSFFKRSWDMIPGVNRAQKRRNKAVYSKKLKILDAEALARQTVDKDYCVYSLSANNADWLMWSYYANGHTGIVVGFNTADFFKNKAIIAVNYKERIPFVKISNSYYERMESGLLTKPVSYSHESEYRVVMYDESSGMKTFSPTVICEIILGCKISSTNIERLRAVIAKLPVRPRILKTVLPNKPGEKFALRLVDYEL